MVQLQNVEVCIAEKDVEWAISVRHSSVKIISRSDFGRVKLTEEGPVLKIILRKNDANTARLPSLEFQRKWRSFAE